jgi:hypothetical protein
MPNSDDDKTREIMIHISTFDHATQALREWAYIIGPKHLAMAREFEVEYCEGGTVSGKIETDRPPRFCSPISPVL